MLNWKRAFPVDLDDEGRFSRREFTRFLALVSAGFTAGLGYLWARRKPLEGAPDAPSDQGHPAISLGGVQDLKPGESRLFTFRDDQDRCILLRTSTGELRAFRQTCTHLGCAVRLKGNQLECPCHQGYFEVDRGFPVAGPPTRPLSGIALEARADGSLWAVGDLSKPTALPQAASALTCPRDVQKEVSA